MDQHDPGRDIELGETTSVVELETRMDVPAVRLVAAAFHELGLMLTIHERLSFEQASKLVAHFGFVARRRDP
jgi:ketopantoate reductase